MALNNPITIIWGPPGTGKTYTMASLARKYIVKGYRVLIVSHSNISVDNVVKSIYHQMKEYGEEEQLDKGYVLRYGYVRDNELLSNNEVVSFNYAIKNSDDLKYENSTLVAERKQILASSEWRSSANASRRKTEIEKRLTQIRKEVKGREREYVLAARVVATTISKVYTDNLFDSEEYDVVMFDEASMAYVPQVIVAAMFATKHFICVGDFRQLGPIVKSDDAVILGSDIFSYLKIDTGTGAVNSHPWLVMLDEQRRMQSRVSFFSNRYCYNGAIRDNEIVKTKLNSLLELHPFSGKPMNLINLVGTYCAAGKNNDNSRYNVLSAFISYYTARCAYIEQNKSENNKEKVGIITPYAAQARLIRAMLLDGGLNDVSCSTVHQFQGSERNVIIFDAVESYPSTKPGYLISKNDGRSVTRLVNVAVTRARSKFITVANQQYYDKLFEGTKNLLFLLIRHLNENENSISIKNGLREFLDTDGLGESIQLFESYDDCGDLLRSDILAAHKQILLSVPVGGLDPQSTGDISSMINTKLSSPVEVMVKSKSPNDLPNNLRRIAYESDDAVVPLIVIDDHIAWYGIPCHSEFVVGKKGFRVILQLIIRITGRRTIGIIKSLADMEYCNKGLRRDKMRKKY